MIPLQITVKLKSGGSSPVIISSKRERRAA
jgi:hypothetical protein